MKESSMSALLPGKKRRIMTPILMNDYTVILLCQHEWIKFKFDTAKEKIPMAWSLCVLTIYREIIQQNLNEYRSYFVQILTLFPCFTCPNRQLEVNSLQICSRNDIFILKIYVHGSLGIMISYKKIHAWIFEIKSLPNITFYLNVVIVLRKKKWCI